MRVLLQRPSRSRTGRPARSCAPHRSSEIVNQPADRLEPVRIPGRGANQIVEQGVATGADAPVEAVLLLPVIHRPVGRGIETAEQRAQEPQELLRAVQQGAEYLVHAIGWHSFGGQPQRQTDIVHPADRHVQPKGDECCQAGDWQPPGSAAPRTDASLILGDGDGPGDGLDVVVGQCRGTGDCQPPEITLGSAGHAQIGVHEDVASRLEARVRAGHGGVHRLRFGSFIRHAQLPESVEETSNAVTAGAALAPLASCDRRHHLDVAAGERRTGQVRGTDVPSDVPAVLHREHLGVQSGRAHADDRLRIIPSTVSSSSSASSCAVSARTRPRSSRPVRLPTACRAPPVGSRVFARCRSACRPRRAPCD